MGSQLWRTVYLRTVAVFKHSSLAPGANYGKAAHTEIPNLEAVAVGSASALSEHENFVWLLMDSANSPVGLPRSFSFVRGTDALQPKEEVRILATRLWTGTLDSVDGVFQPSGTAREHYQHNNFQASNAITPTLLQPLSLYALPFSIPEHFIDKKQIFNYA